MMNAFGFYGNIGGCFGGGYDCTPQYRHHHGGYGYGGGCNPYDYARPQWGCEPRGFDYCATPDYGYGYLNQADANAYVRGGRGFAFSDAYADSNNALGLAGAYASPNDYALALALANKNGGAFSLGLTPDNATFGLNLGNFSFSGALPW
ncbi:MAG: hypothetical protein ACKO37_08445 [Vampirovibrionales bacterium]